MRGLDLTHVYVWGEREREGTRVERARNAEMFCECIGSPEKWAGFALSSSAREQ